MSGAAARTGGPGLRLGLRDRIAVALGAGVLLLSALLAVTTWGVVTRYLIAQREDTTLSQAVVHARAVERSLDREATPVRSLLSGLPTPDGDSSLLYYRGEWYASSLAVEQRSIPAGLRELAMAGQPARQRIAISGRPFLVIGLPVRDGAYFEVFSLAELDHSYRVLGVVLATGTLATGALGLGVGRAASRRALMPLREVTRAAAAVAKGDVATRLEASGDPDLAPLADSFNETTAALQRRVVADARFAGDVSHELRTPMTTMLNSLQLLLNRRGELPPAAQTAVDLLAADLARFRRMVDDLLEISRFDSGDDRGDREQVRVADLVRHAADAAAGRPVTVVDPSAADIRISADKRRLEQVVTNLVENAEHHGGGCLRVRVVSGGQRVRWEVDDAGPGVPAEHRERVFQRFSRGPAGRDSPGAGLGLAIVDRQVRWHGGSVRIEDRPGGGARFVVDLPVDPR